MERSSRVLEDLRSRGECTRFLPRPQCERKGLGRERQTRGSGPGGAGPAPGEGACHTPPAQGCRRRPRSCSWQSTDSRRPAYQKPCLGSARAAVLRGRDPLGAAVTSRSRSPSCSLRPPASLRPPVSVAPSNSSLGVVKASDLPPSTNFKGGGGCKPGPLENRRSMRVITVITQDSPAANSS